VAGAATRSTTSGARSSRRALRTRYPTTTTRTSSDNPRTPSCETPPAPPPRAPRISPPVDPAAATSSVGGMSPTIEARTKARKRTHVTAYRQFWTAPGMRADRRVSPTIFQPSRDTARSRALNDRRSASRRRTGPRSRCRAIAKWMTAATIVAVTDRARPSHTPYAAPAARVNTDPGANSTIPATNSAKNASGSLRATSAPAATTRETPPSVDGAVRVVATGGSPGAGSAFPTAPAGSPAAAAVTRGSTGADGSPVPVVPRARNRLATTAIERLMPFRWCGIRTSPAGAGAVRESRPAHRGSGGGRRFSGRGAFHHRPGKFPGGGGSCEAVVSATPRLTGAPACRRRSGRL